MPVAKKSASLLRKEEKPYESISRETAQAIHNSDALAIWVYLQCKPQNWQIRKSDIMNQLNIGKVRYANAMIYLRELGLITYAYVKDSDGAFQGQIMWCHPELDDSRSMPKVDFSETGLHKDIQTTKDLQNKYIPFKPPTVDEVRAYCRERSNGVDPEQFINHYQANGWMRGKTKIKDWKACVRTWEKNQPKQGSGLYVQ